MRRIAFASTLLIVLGGGAALAQTVRYVDNLGACNGLTPCYSSIMNAVNASAAGDAIAVFPGAYHEAVTITSKDHLTLRAFQPRLLPTIVADGGGAGVTVIASPGARLESLAITAPAGAAVSVVGGASTDVDVEHVFAQSSQGVQFLPAVRARVSQSTIVGGGIGFPQGGIGCVIEGNTLIGAGLGVFEGFVQPSGNVVRGNVIEGGSISFSGRGVQQNTVAANLLHGGFIRFGGVGVTNNLIRGNTVVGGGIALTGNIGSNQIDSNAVTGSPEDGILLSANGPADPNVVQRNTAVDSAACDIDDTSDPLFIANTWQANRFVTRCGSATN